MAAGYHQWQCPTLKELEGFETETASAYNALGLIYIKQGKYAEALAIYEKSIAINEKYDRKVVLGWDHNNVAIAYRNQGNFEQALEIIKNLYPSSKS